MKHTFALLATSLARLPELLRSAFLHPWIATYQIGFGPPLVGASDRLRVEAREARSALDKLEIYFRHCVVNEDERRRLATLHRRLVVRRLGPVEAETLDATYADVVDLRLRLRRMNEPPPGVDPDAWEDIAPEDPGLDHEGRVIFRLDDPRGERLLHHESVAAAATVVEADAALELRVEADAASPWSRWLTEWARASGHAFVDLGRPLPHARQVEDGHLL